MWRSGSAPGSYPGGRGFDPHHRDCGGGARRRLPTRGFNNARFATRYAIVNVSQLESFSDQSQVDAKALLAAGLIKSEDDRIKILGDGMLSRSLTVRAHKFSKSALEKITNAGGQAEEIQPRQTG